MCPLGLFYGLSALEYTYPRHLRTCQNSSKVTRKIALRTTNARLIVNISLYCLKHLNLKHFPLSDGYFFVQSFGHIVLFHSKLPVPSRGSILNTLYLLRHLMLIRRKIKIAVFPLTCQRRGGVGRSDTLFYFFFHVFFSLLKMCIKKQKRAKINYKY